MFDFSVIGYICYSMALALVDHLWEIIFKMDVLTTGAVPLKVRSAMMWVPEVVQVELMST